jgi:hypothetical protein
MSRCGLALREGVSRDKSGNDIASLGALSTLAMVETLISRRNEKETIMILIYFAGRRHFLI